MRVWLRLLTVCLMILALPVQGLASAAMLHCGAGHEHTQGPSDQAPHGGAHQHADADADADADASPHHPDTAEPAKFTELGKVKCSSCASCCTGLALLSVMPGIPDPGPMVTIFIIDVIDIVPVAQTGPDRPPRPSLA